MRRFLLLSALLTCLVALVLAQVKKPACVYCAVPDATRLGLRAAIKSAIGLQKAAKWDELFDLQYNELQETREHFVAFMRPIPRLIGFDVYEVLPIPTGRGWLVYGCAAYAPRFPRSPYSTWSAFEAHATEHGWRTTIPATINLKEAPKGRSCEISQHEEEKNQR